MQSRIELPGIAKTAIWTLRARAEEGRQAGALFCDERARAWLDRLAWPQELDAWYTPRAQLGISVRTRAIDDLVQKHLAVAERPLVVELGCGLSSRYHRIGKGRARWIDFDLPEVIAARRKLDAESDEHRYLAASLLELDWIEAVARARAGDPLILVAEGLLMYFEFEEVMAVLAALGRQLGPAILIFDTQGEHARKINARHTERVSAPLRWAVKNERALRELKLPLEILGVTSLFGVHPQRLGWARLLYWVPAMRNINLFVESQL